MVMIIIIIILPTNKQLLRNKKQAIIRDTVCFHQCYIKKTMQKHLGYAVLLGFCYCLHMTY